jgi:hypothetical protein
VWTSGPAGTLLHWDGVTWTSHQGELPLDGGWTGLWGSSSSSVFAVSGASSPPYRWDGTRWQAERLLGGMPELTAVAGDDAGHVVAVGRAGMVAVRSSAGEWTVQLGLLGGSDTDGTAVVLDRFGTCWAATSGNTPGVTLCDGGYVLQLGPGEEPHGIASTASGDLWVAGASASVDGTLYVRAADSGTWVLARDAGDPLFAITALMGDQILAAGDQDFVLAPGAPLMQMWSVTDRRTRGVWALGASELWAVGLGGEMIHSALPLTNGSIYDRGSRHIVGRFVALPDLLYAVGQNGALLAPDPNGAGWSETFVGGATSTLADIWVSPDAGYGVTMDALWIFETANPRDLGSYDASVAFADGTAVWASSPEDVWVVASNGTTVHRSSDGGWAPVFNAGGAINAISGTSTTRAWMVGPSGLAFHRVDANTWVAAGFTSARDLEAVWVPPEGSQTDAIAVGDGVYRHADGGWLTVVAPAPGGMPLWFSVFGWSEDDYYAVGAQGRALHVLRGMAQPIELGTRNDLFSIAGRVVAGRRELWVGGRDGTVLEAAAP